MRPAFGDHAGMPAHADLRLLIFNDPSFYENGMLLWREGRSGCWIVDPGLPPQPDQIQAAIARNKLTPEAILLTHCHADHIAGVEPLRERFAGLPVWCPRDEARLLTSALANLSLHMGMPIQCAAADRLLTPGQTLELSGLTWTVRDVSGHSPGGLAYYCAAVAVALVGDAVFAEGIGRYDFPHSSRKQLLANIRENILSLPDETMIYPGHGPPATVADIREHNDYLNWELSQ